MSHSAVVDAWRERERLLRDRGHEVRTLSARVWDEAGMPVRLSPRPGEPVEGVATVGRHPALFLYDPRPLWRPLRPLGRCRPARGAVRPGYRASAAHAGGACTAYAPMSLYSAQNLDKRLPLPFRILQRWALRGAAEVSVCNEAAGALVVRRGFPGRPQVIPLGLDPAVFAPDPARSAPAEGAPIVVGYAGRLAPHKGLAVLLDALDRQPRLVLRMAGGWSGRGCHAGANGHRGPRWPGDVRRSARGAGAWPTSIADWTF
ncbi:MAG: glycosyltransferase [Tetrasphaera sp.]|nr:glycosyltransferase [Tetrasphaera sp.]